MRCLLYPKKSLPSVLQHLVGGVEFRDPIDTSSMSHQSSPLCKKKFRILTQRKSNDFKISLRNFSSGVNIVSENLTAVLKNLASNFDSWESKNLFEWLPSVGFFAHSSLVVFGLLLLGSSSMVSTINSVATNHFFSNNFRLIPLFCERLYDAKLQFQITHFP